jgi:DNA 3'-phosphatase
MLKKNYKIIFSDLDDTLIETYTGATFPKGIWDMKIKFKVWDQIKLLQPEYFFICTNQGGISQFVNKDRYEDKLNYIISSLQEYLPNCQVDGIYCSSKDKNCIDRKPNIGMAINCLSAHNLQKGIDFTLDDCLMIGDASGKPGNFSDSDKKFAENLQIDYCDVNEL